MKKIFLVLCSAIIAATSKGQIVTDNFQVGPYEVDYLGKGDVNFRLKKGVDLYEYFGLQKDTIITENRINKPFNRGYEIGASYSRPWFNVSNGAFNSFGLYGLAKSKIGKYYFFNYGLKISFSYGHSRKNKDVLFDAGIPLSIEFANLDYTKSSLFANIGVSPTFYSIINAKEVKSGNKSNTEKKNGLYIAPKVEIGGYISFNEHLIKIGLYGEYRVCCAKDNIFKHRIGRAFVGANVGYIF